MDLRFVLRLLTFMVVCGHAEARMSINNSGRQAIPTPPVQAMTSVALRSSSPTWVTIPRITAGGTTRQYYEISANGRVRAIKVCYENLASTGTTETDGPSSMAGVTSSIEFGPLPNGPFDLQPALKPVSFTFNLGHREISALNVGGELICSDLLWKNFIAGQPIYIRTDMPPGFPYATYQGIGASFDEYTNNGGFIVINTGIVGNGSQTVFNGAITQATSLGNSALNVNLPLRANTLNIAIGSSIISDDGNGNWVNSTGSQLISGSVDYNTGAISLTFNTPPGNGATFLAYGLSLGNFTAPDDTLTVHPPTFFFHGGSSFIPTAIPALAPVMILGYVDALDSPSHTLCLNGDSIMSGIGNTEPKAYPEYMSHLLGIVRVGQGGERAFDWAQLDFRKRRMNMLMYVGCTRVLTGYGSNDITQLFALEDIKTNLLAVWASLAAVLPNGYADITQATITPFTTLSNVPINDALYGPGTVASGNPSVRNALNAWICSMVGQPNGPARILDVNLAMENSPNSCSGAGNGQWANLNLTTDGRHESHLAQAIVLPAMFNPIDGTNPNVVFAP